MVIKECIETKITSECDVLVCGGGFGGISAALAAARQGKRVILLEKEYILGGLGTAGIVTIYLPLCDGLGHQVSFGIVEELFRLSISMGAEDRYPANWLDSDDIALIKMIVFRFNIIQACLPCLLKNFFVITVLRYFTAPTPLPLIRKMIK